MIIILLFVDMFFVCLFFVCLRGLGRRQMWLCSFPMVMRVSMKWREAVTRCCVGICWFTVVSTLSFVCAQVKGTWPGIAVCLAGDFASVGYRQILMLPDEG